ncbi:MAG TPA: hypothetical protein VFH40_16135, partial [Gemmatimonadales bacterium]|nr:hypothetical protein [Gemmatimonadales bacterium]
ERFHQAIADARTTLIINSAEVRERLEDYEQAYGFMSRMIREALSSWQATREERLDKVGTG